MRARSARRLGVLALVVGLALFGFGAVGFESATVQRPGAAGIATDNAALDIETFGTTAGADETFRLLNVTNNLEANVTEFEVKPKKNDSPIRIEREPDNVSVGERETVRARCKRQENGESDVALRVTGEARSTAILVERTVTVECSGGEA